MIVLMGKMQVVSMVVIWVSSATGAMLHLMDGVFEVGQVHQTTWYWMRDWPVIRQESSKHKERQKKSNKSLLLRSFI